MNHRVPERELPMDEYMYEPSRYETNEMGRALDNFLGDLVQLAIIGLVVCVAIGVYRVAADAYRTRKHGPGHRSAKAEAAEAADAYTVALSKRAKR